MKKTLIFVVLLLFNVSYAAFSDMPYDHWAYNAVTKMENNNILSGYPDGTFKPNNNITLAEFASIFDRFFNIEKDATSNYFEDIDSSHWSKENIEAIRRYIDPNYDSIAEHFGEIYSSEAGILADMPVTREIVIYSLYTIFGYDETEYHQYDEHFWFEDADEIQFPKAVCIAYKNGVISGENVDGKIYIRPNRYITRAEISAMFNNLLGLNNKIVNHEGYDTFESVLKNFNEALKKGNLKEASNYIYDTKGILANIDYEELSENKNLKKLINSWCKAFSFKTTGHGFYGYNHAYLKINANMIDTNLFVQKFNLQYKDIVKDEVKEKVDDFDFINFEKFNEMSTNVVVNFVKINNEWKIEI